MNFFFPGLGYVYLGIGRDPKLVTFGILVLLALTLTFYAGVAADLSDTSGVSTTGTPAWLTALSLLILLVPFAFAYDGYNRAQTTR